jgi:hypothetical protein
MKQYSARFRTSHDGRPTPARAVARGSGLGKLYILPLAAGSFAASASEKMSLLTKQGFAELKLATYAAGRCSTACAALAVACRTLALSRAALAIMRLIKEARIERLWKASGQGLQGPAMYEVPCYCVPARGKPLSAILRLGDPIFRVPISSHAPLHLRRHWKSVFVLFDLTCTSSPPTA